METADPAVPTRCTAEQMILNHMLAQVDNPEESQRDHPCQPGQADDAFLHSVVMMINFYS